MLDKLLIEYAEQFKDNFPIFLVKHLEEKEIIRLVKNAIETNTPYDGEYEEGLDY